LRIDADKSNLRFASTAKDVLILLSLGVIFIFVRQALHAQPRLATFTSSVPAAADPRVPVLVELFTSEGCSSCPPADKFLTWLSQNQPVAGADVIIMEQHVDYWDDLGWHDPFSQAAITSRQKDYSFALHSDVYTPQLVVAGTREFVGTDGQDALKAIDAARSAADTTIQLAWTGAAAGDSRTIHIHAGQLPDKDKSAEVLVAITENHLHSEVHAGENAGRGLDHNGVTRELLKSGRVMANAAASFDSQATLKIGKNWKPENLRAVVFIQDPKTRRVLASAEIPY
jgi:hypothetical protein